MCQHFNEINGEMVLQKKVKKKSVDVQKEYCTVKLGYNKLGYNELP